MSTHVPGFQSFSRFSHNSVLATSSIETRESKMQFLQVFPKISTCVAMHEILNISKISIETLNACVNVIFSIEAAYIFDHLTIEMIIYLRQASQD